MDPDPTSIREGFWRVKRAEDGTHAASGWPRLGWVKEVMGFRRFSFRGLEKVQAWDLVWSTSDPPGRLSAPWPTPSRR